MRQVSPFLLQLQHTVLYIYILITVPLLNHKLLCISLHVNYISIHKQLFVQLVQNTTNDTHNLLTLGIVLDL